ncbi:hypothetical protein Tco_0373619 [Tanacetum coccineum]
MKRKESLKDNRLQELYEDLLEGSLFGWTRLKNSTMSSIVHSGRFATYLVEYVKFWYDWEVNRYGNANLDYYSEDQYAVSIKKIRRIRACTHQRPQKIKDQYAVSRGLNTPYSRYGINIIFWKISSVVPTPRNSQYVVSNTWIRRHYRSDCPKLKDQNHGNKSGNKSRIGEARGNAYALGGGDADDIK